MKVILKKTVLLLLVTSFFLHALPLTQNNKKLNILPLSSFYIDHQNLTKEQIAQQSFKKIDTQSLTLGYAPNTTLWIKFKLSNSTDQLLTKIIEYHALVEKVTFYDANKTFYSGMSNEYDKREALTPSFEIQLKAHESRLFWIKASSTFTPLVAKIFLWDKKEFTKEITQYTYTIIGVLLILLFLFFYNLMIFLFTQDRAYLYYILYLLAVIFLHSLYTGVFQLFFLSEKVSFILMQYLPLATAFLVMSMIMFARTFLQTHQFPKIEMTLKLYLYITPIIALLSCNYTFFRSDIMILFMPLGVLLIFAGIYSYYKGVKEALFYLLGWSFVLFALSTVILRSLGLFDITLYISYVNSKAFLLETFLFSIALAHKIKLLHQENQQKQQALLDFQNEEQIRLKKLVQEKTANISLLLKEKELLYKELNHRIKNNLQMMLSLIKLQISQSHLKETQEALIVTKNRINSFAYLYESLYQHPDKPMEIESCVRHIVSTLQPYALREVEVTYHISHHLITNKLLYVILILNELVTNAFKYAFTQKGKLHIILTKKGTKITMIVQDDGKGFSPQKKEGLGLTIVETLVQNQLYGTMDIETDKGTKITIAWEENE